MFLRGRAPSGAARKVAGAKGHCQPGPAEPDAVALTQLLQNIVALEQACVYGLLRLDEAERIPDARAYGAAYEAQIVVQGQWTRLIERTAALAPASPAGLRRYCEIVLFLVTAHQEGEASQPLADLARTYASSVRNLLPRLAAVPASAREAERVASRDAYLVALARDALELVEAVPDEAFYAEEELRLHGLLADLALTIPRTVTGAVALATLIGSCLDRRDAFEAMPGFLPLQLNLIDAVQDLLDAADGGIGTWGTGPNGGPVRMGPA